MALEDRDLAARLRASYYKSGGGVPTQPKAPPAPAYTPAVGGGSQATSPYGIPAAPPPQPSGGGWGDRPDRLATDQYGGGPVSTIPQAGGTAVAMGPPHTQALPGSVVAQAYPQILPPSPAPVYVPGRLHTEALPGSVVLEQKRLMPGATGIRYYPTGGGEAKDLTAVPLYGGALAPSAAPSMMIAASGGDAVASGGGFQTGESGGGGGGGGSSDGGGTGFESTGASGPPSGGGPDEQILQQVVTQTGADPALLAALPGVGGPDPAIDLAAMIERLTQVRPGDIFEMPLVLQRILATQGGVFTKRFQTILDILGFKGIGDIGFYGFNTDYMVPSAFAWNDLVSQVLNQLGTGERVIMALLLNSVLGLESPVPFTPAPAITAENVMTVPAPAGVPLAPPVVPWEQPLPAMSLNNG